MQAALKGNTFAILQEEKQIFRRKEQKERALLKREQHRALREAEIESSKKNTPVKNVEPPLTPLKWADVDDDDDDDDINNPSLLPTSSFDSSTLHPNSSMHPHMLDKEELEIYDDEDDEEYDEEDDANITSGNTHTSLTLACACDTAKAVSKHPSFVKSERISVKPHLLSKKERQMAQLQELEELDVLLNSVSIGKTEKNIPPTADSPRPVTTSLTDTTASFTKFPPTETVETKSRPKKKNKSKAAVVSDISTTSLNPINGANDQPNLSLKETVLAMKKAAVNRKNHKSSNANNVIVESALAEAKKKSEYKKSKQKKEKRFDH